MAQLIKANGETSKVLPGNGKVFTLQELQSFVGGYIEFRHINGEIMVMNEEGKLMGLPNNDEATNVLMELKAIASDDYVVGDVLICLKKEIK
jgi:hypothetical protein